MAEIDIGTIRVLGVQEHVEHVLQNTLQARPWDQASIPRFIVNAHTKLDVGLFLLGYGP
jgi:hypothetical protein